LLLYQDMQKLMQEQIPVAPVALPYRGWLKEDVAAASRSERPARFSGCLPEQLGSRQFLDRRN
jgi:hypothetical protein